MADTSVTVQTLVNNTIVRQKDSQKLDWTDAELLIYVNKARDYIHKLLVLDNQEIAISTGTITMVALTQEYTLSGNLDDFWAMSTNGVYFTGSITPLIPVTLEDKIRFGGSTTNTEPKYYYLTPIKIGIIPIPTATSVSTYGTLNCRYFKKESDLALTDSMPYKNIFNEPVSMFVSNMAMLRLGVDTAEYTAIYNNLEMSVRSIIAKRSQL